LRITASATGAVMRGLGPVMGAVLALVIIIAGVFLLFNAHGSNQQFGWLMVGVGAVGVLGNAVVAYLDRR
jgi:hypothetical protein